MNNRMAAGIAIATAAALGVGVYSSRNTENQQSTGSAPEPTGGSDSRPRGIRNNNPLNIEFNPGNNWQGQIGTDGRFAVFDKAYNGIRAAGRLLRNYDRNYGLNTIRAIVSRWAPPNENDTSAYVQSVSKRSGLFADLILSPGDYPKVVAAMIYHENGQQPYDMALIAQAVFDGME